MQHLRQISKPVLLMLYATLDETCPAPVVRGPFDLVGEQQLYTLAYQAGRRSVVDDICAALKPESEEPSGR